MEQEIHLATVVETLQSIKQSEMSPMLSRIYKSEGGSETLDVLMKYLYAAQIARWCLQPLYLRYSDDIHTLTTAFGHLRYKGMSHTPQHTSGRSSTTAQATGGFSQIQSRGGGEGGGQAMSVLLSWHEKLVEIAGAGSIIRVMTDRRTV